MEHKTFKIDLEKFIKQLDEGEAGTGTAAIAQLNVVDHDNDKILPGAFGDQWSRVQPAHSWQHHMIGKAKVYDDGEFGYGEFKMNLETQAGKDWHSTLKFDMSVGEPLQEWSFGFDVLDEDVEVIDGKTIRVLKKLKVHEISPVLLGAGLNTGTVYVKDRGQKEAFKRHTTPTSDAPWSAADNRKRVNQDEARAYYAKIYGWYDPDGEVGSKGTYRFIHHFVDEDGTPGKASIRACINGIAVLNGARGGTTIPDADRKALYNHLAGHLKDADVDPPALKDAFSGMQLDDEINEAVQAGYDLKDRIDCLKGRVLSLDQKRKQSGRSFGVERLKGLDSATEAAEMVESLRKDLNAPDPEVEQAVGQKLLRDARRKYLPQSQ